MGTFLVPQAPRNPSAASIAATILSPTSVQIALLQAAVEPVFGVSFYSLQQLFGLTWRQIQAPLPAQFPLTMTGLTPQLQFSFRLLAFGAGQTADGSQPSNVVTVTMPAAAGGGGGVTPAPDTTPPTVPGQPVLDSVTSTTATFHWPASVDQVVTGQITSGLAGYLIFNGATQVTPTPITTTSDTVTGLTANTQYSLTVKAVDVAGNVSAASAPLLLTTSAPIIISSSFGIRVSGGKFTDLAGNALQLQGSNFYGLETNFAPDRAAPFWNTTVAQWQQIKNAWKLTHLRFPIDEWAFRTNPTVATNAGNKTYQQIVQQLGLNVIAAGMYPVFDLHWGCPNNVNGGRSIGQPGFADSDNSINHWTNFAAMWAGNNAVILELFNEPTADFTYGNATSANGLSLLKSGGNFTPFVTQNNSNGNALVTTDVTWSVAGTQQMLNAIRAAGFTGVVLYPKPWYCGEIEFDAQVRPVDPAGNMGSAHHQYGYSKGQQNLLNVLDAGFPILITEFTTNIGAIGGYSFCRANGIGFTVWGPGGNGSGDYSQYINTPVWSGTGAPAFQ